MLGDKWKSELPALTMSGPLSANGPRACTGADGAPAPPLPEPPLNVPKGRSGSAEVDEVDGSAYADSSADNTITAAERRAAVEESILLLQVPETIPNPTGLSIISLFA